MPLHFGEVTLDESRRQLLRGEEPLRISPKAFQLLMALVDANSRALSKEELQQRLWPDTFVTEGNLATLVAELRSVLGDDARNPRYIRTVHGFGYSFEAPVVGPEKADAPAGPHRRLRVGLVAILALIGIAGGTLAWINRGAEPTPARSSIESLAVLPFDVRGAEADAHLGLGMADLVITRLTNVRNLSVRPTSAVRGFAGRDSDSLEIGRRLKVDAVLEGSIRASGNRVRVTAQLLDVRQQKPIWADTFDEMRAELFTIEDRISARVADAIVVRLSTAERTMLAKRYTRHPEAYQLYIQGRYYLRAGAGGPYDGPVLAAERFNEAVRKDPAYALGWAGLAEAHAMMSTGGRALPAENYPKAEGFARRALQLDPDLYEAALPLAVVRMFWYLDYAGAERDMLRALTVRPHDSEVLAVYGYLLQSLGRVEEAHAVRMRALEADPLNPKSHWGIANGYLTARRYDLARKTIQDMLAMFPDHFEANIGLIRVLLHEQRYEEAIRFAKKLVDADPRPRSLAFLAYALAKGNRQAEAREVLRELQALARSQYIDSISLIIVHTVLEERDAAFALLDTAVENRELAVRLKTEPLLDPLRSDPRFDSLLRRAGFPAS
jgi:TolB-like protein/DNA-binding winged helix-turn-helix (wHTH) protein/Tfp pilus assembly protein PilF